jgi:hypothetical protein
MSRDLSWLVFVVIGPLPLRFQSMAVLEMLHVLSLIPTSILVFVSSTFFSAMEVMHSLKIIGEWEIFPFIPNQQNFLVWNLRYHEASVR